MILRHGKEVSESDDIRVLREINRATLDVNRDNRFEYEFSGAYLSFKDTWFLNVVFGVRTKNGGTLESPLIVEVDLASGMPKGYR